MSLTYMGVVNELLSEMNEVLLTSSTFASATNIQRHTKEAVMKAYLDINNPEFKWPWLQTAASQSDYFGNTYIETVAGQRWYLLKDGSADFNSDYGHVDWNNFLLTEEGVAGKTAPYVIRNLDYITVEEWKDWYLTSESQDKSNSQVYGVPLRVIRNPDNRRFGLSPIPKEVYRIYFYAWDRPVEITLYNDTLVLPDQYKQVLLSRARYYTWQRKENQQQAQIALQEYEAGLKGMQQQELNPAPDCITDTRIRYV